MTSYPAPPPPIHQLGQDSLTLSSQLWLVAGSSHAKVDDESHVGVLKISGAGCYMVHNYITV